VEMVRLDVVQKRCIGNPAEVDSLNSQLSIISRQVSDLKSKSLKSCYFRPRCSKMIQSIVPCNGIIFPSFR